MTYDYCHRALPSSSLSSFGVRRKAQVDHEVVATEAEELTYAVTTIQNHDSSDCSYNDTGAIIPLHHSIIQERFD